MCTYCARFFPENEIMTLADWARPEQKFHYCKEHYEQVAIFKMQQQRAYEEMIRRNPKFLMSQKTNETNKVDSDK
jgi:hypothetical protein